MKTLKPKSSASFQHEGLHEQNSDFTNVLVSHSSESSLTPEQESELLGRLKKLAEMPDSEIDFSEIPEWTEEDFRRAVRGAHAPRSAHQLTLYLDDETAAWLSANARPEAVSINFALKQAVQHGRRALRERKEGSERPIYETASEEFKHGLELLSGRRVPELKYVELPEYSDAELKSFGLESRLDLKPYEVVVFVDDEVLLWLQESALTHAFRTNYAIKYVANRKGSRSPHAILGKAS